MKLSNFGKYFKEMSVYHDEIEIEDMEYDEDTETYHYPCPCGDRFEITKVEMTFMDLCFAIRPIV